MTEKLNKTGVDGADTFLLTWGFPAASDSGAVLGGLEDTCWPTEGEWLLTGAEGRAKADGLLWVWGMGRALWTGLGLGSPDFIFEATWMAGIFSPESAKRPNPTPLAPSARERDPASCRHKFLLTHLRSWCCQKEDAHGKATPDRCLDRGAICQRLQLGCGEVREPCQHVVQRGGSNLKFPPVSH